MLKLEFRRKEHPINLLWTLKGNKMSSERPSDRQSERGADKHSDRNTEYTGAEILVKWLS